MSDTSLNVEIHKNAFDNWYGHVNGRRYVEFHNSPTMSQEEAANAWKERMLKCDVYHNVVAGTGMPGRYAVCENGNFLYQTFDKKTTAIAWLAKHAQS